MKKKATNYKNRTLYHQKLSIVTDSIHMEEVIGEILFFIINIPGIKTDIVWVNSYGSYYQTQLL